MNKKLVQTFVGLGAAVAAQGVTSQAFADTGTPGFSAGVEATFLTPYSSETALSPGGGTLDAAIAPRVWAAYNWDNGLGARATYWNHDDSGTVDGFFLSIDVATLDLEVTQNFDLDHGSVLLSGGVRLVDFSMSEASFTRELDGMGVTFAAEGVREISPDGAWAIAASGRVSAVFGDTGGSSTDVDDLISTLQMRVGPQYSFTMNGGTAVTVGAGLESQYWNNGSLFDTQDAGYNGFYLSASAHF